jgi:hypothetical protein
MEVDEKEIAHLTFFLAGSSSSKCELTCVAIDSSSMCLLHTGHSVSFISSEAVAFLMRANFFFFQIFKFEVLIFTKFAVQIFTKITITIFYICTITNLQILKDFCKKHLFVY